MELNKRGVAEYSDFGHISFMVILAVDPSESVIKVGHSSLASENFTNNQPTWKRYKIGAN